MEDVLHQLRLVVHPIIYRVLYIPGGAGFLPSTVGHSFLLFASIFLCFTGFVVTQPQKILKFEHQNSNSHKDPWNSYIYLQLVDLIGSI